MSMTPTLPVVGVFTDRVMAERAMEALYNAGFQRELIRYAAPGSSGGIFADLKSLFTGTSSDGGTLASDLTHMGLSPDDAQYYSSEYANGNTILSVGAQGREQEALSILRQYGSRGSGTQSGTNDATYDAPGGASQGGAVTVDQPVSASNRDAQPQAAGDVAYTQAGEEDAGHDIEDETTQPMPYRPVSDPPGNAAQAGAATPLVAPPQTGAYEAAAGGAVPSDDTPDEQVATAATESAGQDAQYQATPAAAGSADEATAIPQSEAHPQDPLMNEVAPMQAAQPGAFSPASGDAEELQQLLQQLQLTQQQLQDAKAQLQSAKEQEMQLQSARERETQLQGARQQLQDTQAELQATMEELRETQTRIGQSHYSNL